MNERQGHRILVVDDDPEFREMASDLLEGIGHDVRTVGNGQDCLNAMRSSSFDLLVLDIMMPKADGFAVLRSIRSKELYTGKHIPILCITGMPADDFEDSCYRWGGDSFMKKPFRREAFLTVLDRLLEHTGTEVPPTSGGDQLFDYQRLLETFGGKEQIAKEILSLFVVEAEERMGRLLAAFASNDVRGVEEQSHTLKSISGTVGALRLSELCSRLETRASEPDAAAIAELVPLVRLGLTETLVRIRTII